MKEEKKIHRKKKEYLINVINNEYIEITEDIWEGNCTRGKDLGVVR